MFIDHYAAALGGKAFEQRAPLWSYVAVAVWGWRRGVQRLQAAGAFGFLALLVPVQILLVTAPLIADPVGFGIFGLVIYLGFTVVAALIDQSDNGDNRDAA